MCLHGNLQLLQGLLGTFPVFALEELSAQAQHPEILPRLPEVLRQDLRHGMAADAVLALVEGDCTKHIHGDMLRPERVEEKLWRADQKVILLDNVTPVLSFPNINISGADD